MDPKELLRLEEELRKISLATHATAELVAEILRLLQEMQTRVQPEKLRR